MTDTQDIHVRLQKLPHKVALPLRELVLADHLSEQDAGLILDAGDCAGDHHRLLGFAVGYLHLRAQGVPVHDVIRMAKAQTRRINLAWSAARWKAEHERLSRAETLATLARENVAYDVAKFAAHLPKRFSGYLIRSSRRLGMEGLRQRHCVASYHGQLLAGSCAIAAVFVDGKRWTVQLVATADADAKLRIAQIRTRFNELPSAATRERIHDLLGIAAAKTAQPSVPAAEEMRLYMDTLRRLLPVLRDHAVRSVTVSFHGSGDSGSIEYIGYAVAAGIQAFDADAVMLERQTASTQFDDGRWVRTFALEQGSVADAVGDLTYDYLEETGVDWYNNDGGYGDLVIDVARGTVCLDVNVRYTESTNEYSRERDIVTGEEV